jgi:hypothetical protein
MEVLWIALAILGALSVYLGYRLFIDSPARILSGALLALFGVAILSADLIGATNRVTEPPPTRHHAKPTGANRHARSTDWLV